MFSIYYPYDLLSSFLCTDRFLGDARFDLQMNNISRGSEDTVYGNGLFFWSPEPHLYCVRFAYQLLGGTKVLELLLRTPHDRGQLYWLASRILRIGCVNYTHLFVWKGAVWSTTRPCGSPLHGMYFWDPFLMKRRSPLDVLSSSTLGPLLALSNAPAESF